MYSACSITASTCRNSVIPYYTVWTTMARIRKGYHGARSIVSSVQNCALVATSDQKDVCAQSRTLRSLSEARCQRSHLCRPHPVHTINAVRNFATSNNFHAMVKQGAITSVTEETNLFIKALDSIGITWKLRYNRFRIRMAAQRMYGSCVDDIDIQKFFKACNMADTLFSWFLVTQLHVWMSMVRLRQEGREGKYMIHYLVYCMWYDVEARSKAMGISSYKVKEGIKQMVGQFHACLFAYDEGILSDDRAMAAALWRTLFLKKCDDPRQVAYMVEYVRKQIQYLETLNSAQLLQTGRVKWLPFEADIPAGTDAPSKVTIEEQLETMSQAEQIKS